MHRCKTQESNMNSEVGQWGERDTDPLHLTGKGKQNGDKVMYAYYLSKGISTSTYKTKLHSAGFLIVLTAPPYSQLQSRVRGPGPCWQQQLSTCFSSSCWALSAVMEGTNVRERGGWRPGRVRARLGSELGSLQPFLLSPVCQNKRHCLWHLCLKNREFIFKTTCVASVYHRSSSCINFTLWISQRWVQPPGTLWIMEVKVSVHQCLCLLKPWSFNKMDSLFVQNLSWRLHHGRRVG